MQTTITKDKNIQRPNSYNWHGLSLDDLDMLAHLCASQANTHPLAHDCYHEIINFFFDYDREVYDRLRKLHD